MNQIKQITQADLGSASTVQKTIRKGGSAGTTVTVDYYVIPSSKLGNDNITKMGYCTNDNRGKNYPIFLTLNGTETEFQIGKTGMFEFQPESWKNINDDDQEERVATVALSEVKVPVGFNFCLDYYYSI